MYCNRISGNSLASDGQEPLPGLGELPGLSMNQGMLEDLGPSNYWRFAPFQERHVICLFLNSEIVFSLSRGQL